MKPLSIPMLAAAIALTAWSCGPSAPPRTHEQKLVILGFDGMEPTLVERWMREGRLPNFAKLAAEGGYQRLETSHSPESPTAWASFATGTNAGKHNIYDFLVRDPRTYMPDLGLVKRTPAQFLFNYIPIKGPKLEPLRGGTSFWVTAGLAGVRSSVLTVPVTFPAEQVANGELLSGLPLPDIRGTIGTFYYFATDLSRYEEGSTEMGGILKRLAFEGDTAHTELVGPPNPIVRAQQHAIQAKGPNLSAADQATLTELAAHEDVRIPITVRWNRQQRRAIVTIGDNTVTLDEGQWSKWVNLEFRVNVLIRLHGMAQLYLIKADKDLQLYISPVNLRPDKAPVPISSPASFSEELHDRLGPFRTLGWSEATWPLNEERINEEAFMEDLYRAFDDRAQVILNRVDSGRWDLLVGVIEATDRVQHMMWRFMDKGHPMYTEEGAARYGDAIERVYRRADQFLAEVRERVGPDVPIIVMSDHGFHSFRYAVNLNTWLVQEGYLAVKGERPGTKTLDNLFLGTGQFWENVDWSRTKAYALGLGQVFINVRGREGQGIVAPGDAYRQVVDDLAARLLTFKDPSNGASVVSGVYKRDDIYTGQYVKDAPDLQVGMTEGYRVSWQTTLGGSPAGLIYPNTRKWSGDHCGFDYKSTPGMIISSRAFTVDAARIIDIAPTVLKHFGVAIPKDIDGRPLF
ncbi:MAG: alkaline phosphatase family protein [Vicinamibacterales bacterium]|nr:alkaline phosphatase family protein [Vicinamibacterales bacterium]